MALVLRTFRIIGFPSLDKVVKVFLINFLFLETVSTKTQKRKTSRFIQFKVIFLFQNGVCTSGSMTLLTYSSIKNSIKY